MTNTRFEVRIDDSADAQENGCPYMVWDTRRKKAYGWYMTAHDARENCLWLNATNGKVD